MNEALARSCERFIDYLRDVRQLSTHPLTNYQRDLQSLQAWASNNQRASAAELNEADIRAWISLLHRRGLAGSSIQRSLSAARSFFNFLGRENGHSRNPAASVQAPASDWAVASPGQSILRGFARALWWFVARRGGGGDAWNTDCCALL